MMSKGRSLIELFEKNKDSAFHGFWCVPVILICRVLAPLVTVRFGFLRSDRVGHFGAHALLSAHKAKIDKSIDLYYLSGVVSNTFLSTVFKRSMRIYSWVKHLCFWNQLIPGATLNSSIPPNYIYDRCFWAESEDIGIEFTAEEHRYARDWLESKGWKPHQPIVCLQVRDEAYLRDFLPKQDWSYHDYRDCEISSFELSVIWLLEQGAFVIRTGKLAKSRLVIDSECFVDYPFDSTKEDFLDVWMFSNCDLCISTGTGLDTLAGIHRIPLLLVNYVPIDTLYRTSNVCTAPKLLYKLSERSPLNVEEYFKCLGTHPSNYNALGIQISPLAPGDLLEIVKEFWMCEVANYDQVIKNSAAQRKFWNLWNSYCGDGYAIHPRARISDFWLRKFAGDQFFAELHSGSEK